MYCNRDGTLRGYPRGVWFPGPRASFGLEGAPTVCDRHAVGLRASGLLYVAGLATQALGGQDAWNAASLDVRNAAALAALDRIAKECPTVAQQQAATIHQVRKWIQAGNLKSVISGESLLKGLAKTIAPVAAVGMAIPAVAAAFKFGKQVISGGAAPAAPEEAVSERPIQTAVLGGALLPLLAAGVLMFATTRR